MKHALFCVVALLAATTASAQDPLSVARDLYASAAYEDALSALSGVEESAPELALQVDEYRAFSLFALGRTDEATSAVEAVIRRDPLAVPDPRDASPRITTLFGDVRKRLLPDLIREGYRSARATMDKGDMAGAVAQLTRVKGLLDHARTIGAVDEAFTDMGVLVNGFLDLARSVAELATSAAVAEAAAAPSAPAAATSAASAAASVLNRPARVFSAADIDVTAPQTIRQQVPVVPYSLARAIPAGQASGVLELLIDEEGNVEQAVMRQTVNPFFDAAVLTAARSWQYRPATKDGQAVRYVKRIGVSVALGAR